MDLKYKIGIGVVVVGAAFAVGRFTSPVKTKIVTQIVKDENKTTKENEDKNTHKQTITKEHVNSDGSKDITTTIVEDGNVKKDKNIQDDTKTVEKQETTVTKGSSGAGLTISALVGTNPFVDRHIIVPVYGGLVSKQLLGPLSIGAFGFNSGLIGGSIGVTF